MNYAMTLHDDDNIGYIYNRGKEKCLCKFQASFIAEKSSTSGYTLLRHRGIFVSLFPNKVIRYK